jgi:hypothetical protein
MVKEIYKKILGTVDPPSALTEVPNGRTGYGK